MQSKYVCIVWDWNGTIINDVEVSLQAVNDILQKRNKPPITLEQYRSYIDVPITKFYDNIFDLKTEISFEVIQREFNDAYHRHLPERPLNDHIPQLMQKMHDCGVRQVIVSSSHQVIVEKNAERFGVKQYLDAVSGSDDHFVGSKVERAVAVIRKITTDDFSKVVVIGDTLHDCELAEELGADCILISTGHQSKEDLLSTGKPVVDNGKELEKYLFV